VRTLAGLAAVIASYQAITAAHDQRSAPESATTAG
jgi:hypothetical protein